MSLHFLKKGYLISISLVVLFCVLAFGVLGLSWEIIHNYYGCAQPILRPTLWVGLVFSLGFFFSYIQILKKHQASKVRLGIAILFALLFFLLIFLPDGGIPPGACPVRPVI